MMMKMTAVLVEVNVATSRVGEALRRFARAPQQTESREDAREKKQSAVQ